MKNLLKCPGCGKLFAELNEGLCDKCNSFGYHFVNGVLHCANNCEDKENGNMADCWRIGFTCVNCGEKHVFEHDDPIHEKDEIPFYWKCPTCGRSLNFIEDQKHVKQSTLDSFIKVGGDYDGCNLPRMQRGNGI